MRHRELLAALIALSACTSRQPVTQEPVRTTSDCGPEKTEPDRTAMRAACAFSAGARPSETLGETKPKIERLVISMQENRSFDHYFGRLGHGEGWPEGWTNPDGTGRAIAPFHMQHTCLAKSPPHQWGAMHAMWNDGKMDGFIRASRTNGDDGHFALGYLDEQDLPFYAWLARTWSLSDRHFASVMTGTWPNRQFLYAATSLGARNTNDPRPAFTRTIFDALDEAGVEWGVFTGDGPRTSPRQYCIGWSKGHRGVESFARFLERAKNGTLPKVSFVDPKAHPDEDEHPPYDVQRGEAWSRRIYDAVTQSPHWPTLAWIHTYDEAGGFFDHVSPPKACPPSADQATFDRLGFRVPLIVVSPYARRGVVSHEVHDHAAITRLIEALFDLPALTARDANANALLDVFDFTQPRLDVPIAPAAGTGACL